MDQNTSNIKFTSSCEIWEKKHKLEEEKNKLIVGLQDKPIHAIIQERLNELTTEKFISFDFTENDINDNLKFELQAEGYEFKFYVASYVKNNKKSDCCTTVLAPQYLFAIALSTDDLPEDLAKPKDIKKTGAGFTKDFIQLDRCSRSC